MKLQRARILFLGKFLALVTGLYLLIALKPVDRTVVTPFTRGVSSAAAWILTRFDEPVRTSGTMLISQGFAVDVKNGCNGLEATLLLLAAVLAFPSPWKQRVVGLLAGFLWIQILNLVRVVSLFILGRDYPHLFETFHVTIWQSVIFLLTIAFFVLWSSKFAVFRRAEAGA